MPEGARKFIPMEERLGALKPEKKKGHPDLKLVVNNEKPLTEDDDVFTSAAEIDPPVIEQHQRAVARQIQEAHPTEVEEEIQKLKKMIAEDIQDEPTLQKSPLHLESENPQVHEGTGAIKRENINEQRARWAQQKESDALNYPQWLEMKKEQDRALETLAKNQAERRAKKEAETARRRENISSQIDESLQEIHKQEQDRALETLAKNQAERRAKKEAETARRRENIGSQIDESLQDINKQEQALETLAKNQAERRTKKEAETARRQENIGSQIDESLQDIQKGQNAEAFFQSAQTNKASTRVEMRGMPMENIKEARQKPNIEALNMSLEAKNNKERALEHETRIENIKAQIRTSFGEVRENITPRERAELIPLQEKLIAAEQINDADAYQTAAAIIETRLNRYRKQSTPEEKRQQRVEGITLSNPPIKKEGFLSKIRTLFGFGKEK